MRPLRVYADTSVIGGCLDEEFAEDSIRLLDAAREGRVVLLVSEIVTRELRAAPAEVRAILATLPESAIEYVPITVEVIALRDAYLAAGFVRAGALDDTTHVAAAAVARADAIVSWNFRDIVRLDKIRRYNEVNLGNGYGILTILSPREVAFDDRRDGSHDV